MSLRKSPELTPELLAATRQNARHSTGPRSPAAKQHSKVNALKHGAYVAEENYRPAMRALGEDPQGFENSKQELLSAFGPGDGDALWERQIEDLAWLYSRRDRLERAQEGLRRRALQGIDDWQHRRRQEMARVTFDASQHEMIDLGLSRSTDQGVRLRMTLSYLEVVQDEIKQRTFRVRQSAALEPLYKGMIGWRQALIFDLMYRFSDPAALAIQQHKNQEYREFLRKQGSEVDPPGEPERQELLRLLEEEIASVREEFEYAERANEERVAIERDACLAPEGETWSMLLRQEAALDRSIDRKVRILLRLRKELADLVGTRHGVSLHPPDEGDGGRTKNKEGVANSDNTSYHSRGREGVETSKTTERRGNVFENKGSALHRREQSRNVTESRHSRSAGILPANPEQGGNVAEREVVGMS
jgi:hypothetical protein